jgi:penicillin-binding protein 1A
MHLVTRPLLALIGALATLALGALIAGSAAWYYLEPGLPDAETIRDVPLQVPLRVYSRDGRLIAQLGEYRRTPVSYADVPEVMVKAILAAEDDRFFEHPGFDYRGIVRAALNLALTGERTQGGSTITQQLARAYFLSSERTFVRKAKEILLATRIEQSFSKEEILTLYLNKIFLGQRAYGVAAAAQVYFDKSIGELTVAEAAMLAGIPKAPSVLNPVSDPRRAEDRRAYVLRRMLELGYIDSAQHDEALATPISAKLHGPSIELDAPYIAEMVRAEMVARFGDNAYSSGFEVTTTVDSRLQRQADLALRTTLLEYDQRHGYRGPLARDALGKPGVVADDERSLQRLLDSYPVHPDLYPAVMLSAGPDNGAEFFVNDIGRVSVGWDRLRRRPYVDDQTVGPQPENIRAMLAPGDVVYLLQTADGGWQLAQLPIAQGALVALDPRDGATTALAGGYDFFASKFNRAIQAKRQPGSSFKPFVYSAALANGFTPASIVNDAPVVFENSGPDGTWRPENNTGRFYGPTRLREGLVRSLNLVSVRVLLDVGIGNAIRHIRPFGLPDSALPANPTMALGSGAATPRDMAAGFAVFANGGFRVSPYLIDRVTDASGATVFAATPQVACEACAAPWEGNGPPPRPMLAEAPEAAADSEPQSDAVTAEQGDDAPTWCPAPAGKPVVAGLEPAPRVVYADNAFLVYDMMRDVISRGTGRRALALGRDDLAGKTGTSNDRRDAWFSGFNSELVATTWVGFDQERTLGPREEGGRTALPMWISFMEVALRDRPSAPLAQPPGIVTASISPETGLLAPAGDPGAIFEYFRGADMARLVAESDAGTNGDGTPAAAMDMNEIF